MLQCLTPVHPALPSFRRLNWRQETRFFKKIRHIFLKNQKINNIKNKKIPAKQSERLWSWAPRCGRLEHPRPRPLPPRKQEAAHQLLVLGRLCPGAAGLWLRSVELSFSLSAANPRAAGTHNHKRASSSRNLIAHDSASRDGDSDSGGRGLCSSAARSPRLACDHYFEWQAISSSSF